jgi:hypothetical protein
MLAELADVTPRREELLAAFGEPTLPEEYPAATPSFADTTLQCLEGQAVDPAASNRQDFQGDAEYDFDEQLESLPLPWTRGTLGDDRDVIVIEEEEAVANTLVESETKDRPRRMEYRELFAQLRRATS